jgi:hypothetical protein
VEKLRTIARIALIGFAISLAVAVALYPGGDQLGGRDAGFSLSRNYVCDLASRTAVDGRLSPSMPWARAAMGLFVVGLVLVWGRKLRGAAGRLDRWAARLGIGGAVVTLFLPMGRLHLGAVDLHPFITLGAAVPEMVAVVLATISARRAGRGVEAYLGFAAVLTAAVTALLYVHALATGAPAVALPIVQKIAVVAALAWLLAA